MSAQLSENIRAYRLEKGWTQQQLADAMELSIGAVSKWESGISRPELDTLLRLAELFDISTDALLGHQSGMAGAQQAAGLIKDLRINKKHAKGIERAEMALLKYPNHFLVAYQSAVLFRQVLMESRDRAAGERALQLYDRAATLLGASGEQGVSQQSIQSERALVLATMGETDQALKLYRENNVGGVNNNAIGSLLFSLARYEESLTPLSSAYLFALSGLFNSMVHLGQSLVNLDRGQEGLAALQYLRQSLIPLLSESTSSYIDRMLCALLAIIGGVQLHLGEPALAEQAVREAIHYARRYDDAPSPYGEAIPHYHGPHSSLSDRIGGSLLEGMTRELEEGMGERGKDDLYQLWLRVLKEDDHGQG